jgi:hypothetical protein
MNWNKVITADTHTHKEKNPWKKLQITEFGENANENLQWELLWEGLGKLNYLGRGGEISPFKFLTFDC